MASPKADQVPIAMTSDVIVRIVDRVSRGSHYETAAVAAGISRVTLWRWLHAGRKALRRREEGETLIPVDEVKADFVAALDTAEAEAEAVLVDNCHAFAREDAKFALLLLERRHAKRWGPQARAPIEDLTRLSDAELLRRAEEEIARRRAMGHETDDTPPAPEAGAIEQ